MRKKNFEKWKIIVALLIIPVLVVIPVRVSGDVKPIEETQGKLEDITEEEKNVLNELFMITQKIESLGIKQIQLNKDSLILQEQIAELEKEIEYKKVAYDSKLEVLEQVLSIYQRGGPASYLEILLGADSFSTFLKSINAIKDISRNISGLLSTLKEEKQSLQEQRKQAQEKEQQLVETKTELKDNLNSSLLLKQQREEYLISLQEQRVHYEEYLSVLKSMWEDCTILFGDIVAEITRVVEEGYLTYEALNLKPGFIRMDGAIIQEEFNQILKDNSELPGNIFHFDEGEVMLEVRELQLVLHGNFFIASDSAIQYEVTSATFYGMPLDEVSIQEIFKNGPLFLDFDSIAGDMVAIDYTLEQVESKEKQLTFVIKLIW